MTQELEKKLNELLGMKKQLDEITEEKKKTAALDRYQKEAKAARIRFFIAFGLALLLYFFFMLLAASIVCVDGDNFINLAFIGLGILSLAGTGIAKIGLLIRQSKLTILQEMKESELRILEMLKK